MIASVLGFWHWLKTNRVAAVICALLFVIASAFSVHSVRGYLDRPECQYETYRPGGDSSYIV